MAKEIAMSFRLTIWNVNYFTDEQLQLLLECFILTKWYVNSIIMRDLIGRNRFILTKWYVNSIIMRDLIGRNRFILTKWYVNRTDSIALEESLKAF
ncbi:hypothetical protein QGQ_3748 [Clostridioides difficile 342]|uniref:hypothetical protein n=2 Tax=Clostridioides difficile TaxID=1496 RepID=UPI00038D4438|nr:hypothetical protein [Clostridioides difficile]EQF11980.1 hypothetical protein QEI_2332 [Clostridioides difficile CD129]EQF85530.1 hypothetical protein QGQ_3748 [Clostridioides difficile 342]